MKKRSIFDWVALISTIATFVFILIALLAPLANAFRITSGTLEKDYGTAYSYIFGGNISSDGRVLSKKIIEAPSIFGVISFSWICVSLLLNGFCSVFYKKSPKLLVVFKILSSVFLFAAGILFIVGKHEYIVSHVNTMFTKPSNTIISTNFKNSGLLFGFWGATMFSILASLAFQFN